MSKSVNTELTWLATSEMST